MLRPVAARLAVPVVLAATLLLPAPAAAQDQHRAILRDKLQGGLQAVADDFGGVVGIQVVDLISGDRFGVNADLVFPQGSAIKIPVLFELFRRAEEEPSLLERRVEIRRDDQVGGSGVLRHLADGSSALSLEDLAVLMIQLSDNTATNLLIDELGMEAVNGLSASLGAPTTLLQRKMIRPDASARGEENLSTPAEAATIMERIARCDLPMSEPSCFRVQQILELPKDGAYVDPLPAELPVAWKAGGIEGVATAWGLVSLPDRPYVLVVMSSYGVDGSAAVRGAAEAAWDHFRRLARSTDWGARVPLEVLRRNRPGGGGGR